MTGPVILVVEHEAECPPAHLGAWLEAAGCTLEVCRPYAGDSLPDLAAYDAMLVLGGAVGANDDATCAWLAPLKELVREAAGTGVPTLGVCLGHQIVGAALGGTVGRNPLGQQVGVLDVGWTAAAAEDPLFATIATPRRGIQWNSDLVSVLPDGAVLLAATPAAEVQAARFSATVWGVQLHPEADESIVRAWAEGDRDEHVSLGIDQERALQEIDEARAELDAAWQPLAERFAAIVEEHR